MSLFNILFRLGPSRMLAEGFEYGEEGVRAFAEIYGLLEKITVIEPADNACSEARVAVADTTRRDRSPDIVPPKSFRSRRPEVNWPLNADQRCDFAE
jgi:hypothetical protein